MATQSTVTGPVQTPFGATPDRGYIRFQLTDWDAEGGTVITTTAVEEPIDVDTQDFSASLWASSEGDRGVNYKVTAVWYYETVDKWVEDEIGYCEVGTSGPYALGDILVDVPVYPSPIDVAELAQTAVDAAAAAAASEANAADSEANAADSAASAADSAANADASATLAVDTVASNVGVIRSLSNTPYLENSAILADFARSGYAIGSRAGINELTTFDDLFTFTRASTATYFDADGVLQTAAVDEPRFDHDPVTGEALGILVEESRTNVLTHSSDPTKWSGTGLSIEAGAMTAPDGTQTAPIIRGDGGAIAANFNRAAAVSSTVITASFYFKAIQDSTRNEFPFIIRNNTTGQNLSNTLVDTTDMTSSNGLWSITEVGDGWFRIAATQSSGISSGDIVAVYFGATGGPIYQTSEAYSVWGLQLENGEFETSYIPTSGAAVTRSAETCTLDLGNNWFLGEASIFVEFTASEDWEEGQHYAVAADYGNWVYTNLNNWTIYAYDAVTVGNYGSASNGDEVKLGAAFSAVDGLRTFKGGVAEGTFPAVTGLGNAATLFLGSSRFGADQINSHIKQFALFSKDIGDTKLVELTA